MKKNFLHSRAGFTLVELMIAMTIFGIMSVMTIMIYFNVSENSRRMQISRELNETARQITERIAEEIKMEWLTPEADSQGNSVVLSLQQTFGFSDSEIVGIGLQDGKSEPKKYFIYGKDNAQGKCEDVDKNNANVHCGLYLVDAESQNSSPYDLVDAFRENENKKRVKISDLQFKVAGNDSDAKKLTLKMTLELTQRSGIPASLIKSSKLEIQTTFSERIYKFK